MSILLQSLYVTLIEMSCHDYNLGMGLVFALGYNVSFLGWKQIKGLQVWFKLIKGLLCEVNASECKYVPIWSGSEWMFKTSILKLNSHFGNWNLVLKCL